MNHKINEVKETGERKMKLSAKVLSLLMTSDFEDWYETEFKAFAEGDEDASSKEQILAWLSNELE